MSLTNCIRSASKYFSSSQLLLAVLNNFLKSNLMLVGNNLTCLLMLYVFVPLDLNVPVMFAFSRVYIHVAENFGKSPRGYNTCFLLF